MHYTLPRCTSLSLGAALLLAGSASQVLADSGTLYGAFNLLSSATWGDGDAAGNTDGSERTTKIEDAYLGWRSADLFPALGQDGVDFSAGRQVIKLGRGFLINDDGPNLGNGPANGALDRGGAYYLAARHAFDRTAVLRLGGEQGDCCGQQFFHGQRTEK